MFDSTAEIHQRGVMNHEVPADDAEASRVLAPQRREMIVGEVRRRGAVRVRELTELLGVSDMTIRRDLDVLAEAGRLDKIHGGATALDGPRLSPSSLEPGFAAKSDQQLDEKMAIARAAAESIEAGSSIGITAGTTTWHLAHLILDISSLVVVTNSLRVVEVLHEARRPNLTVVLTGGVPTPSDAMVGPVAERSLQSLHLDQLFMGVHGMDERMGFSTPNLMEAGTNQAFIEATSSVVVLADHTKWGIAGLSSIVPLGDVDRLVTDDQLGVEAMATLESNVGEVVAVSTGERRSFSKADIA